MQQPNYLTPKLPAHLRKTYSIASPLQTHTRPGTCEEADCVRQRDGWITRLDLGRPDGQYHAETIRNLKGYQYTVTQREDGLTDYTFGPGQDCFEQHRVPLERPAFFIVRGGDHRGNPRGTNLRHSGAENWLDDFSSHQQSIADAIEQG